MWQKHSQSDYLYEFGECLGIPFIISPEYWLLFDLCHQKSILLSITNEYLTWILSHKGIESNERADELVKLSAKQDDRIDLEIPYSDLFLEARNSVLEQCRAYLDEKFRWKDLHYEQFFRSQTDKWFNKHFFKREEIILIYAKIITISTTAFIGKI